jgi:hypothetical protein
VDMYLRVSSRN